MFTELMNNIWDEFARYIFNVEVAVEPEQQQESGQRWGLGGQSTSSTGTLNYAGGRSAQGSEAITAAAGGAAAAAGVADVDPDDEQTINPLPVVETRRLDENEKIGRNDPCWCGSGKKFKKCHGA
jgi:preprotein translocase subunit SecA